jgi:hypothetical protein
MPFEAAKAIAATFCYDIRWALTPIFGNDFPSTCTPPSDPHFAKFVIDPRIVQQCTEETDRFKEEGEWYKLRRVPETPRPKFGTPPWSVNIKTQPRMRLVDTESGYGTDTDSSDKHMCSPHFSPRSQYSGWRAPSTDYRRHQRCRHLHPPLQLHQQAHTLPLLKSRSQVQSQPGTVVSQ